MANNWRQPTIAVDCNNVIHIVGQKKSDSVAAVANLCDRWAQHGFFILLAVGGTWLIAKPKGGNGAGRIIIRDGKGGDPKKKRSE